MIPECHGELIIRAFGYCEAPTRHTAPWFLCLISLLKFILLILSILFCWIISLGFLLMHHVLQWARHWVDEQIRFLQKFWNFKGDFQYPVCLQCDWEFIIIYVRQLDKYFYFSGTRISISMSLKKIILWVPAFCHYICNIYSFLECSRVQSLLAGFIGTHCSGMSTGWCQWGLTEQCCCRDSRWN